MFKLVGNSEFNNLKEQARESTRLRSHLNLHESLDANVQRLFIATEPDTYIRPHRHPQSHKWELFVVLDGKIELLLFNNEGDITERVMLTPDGIRAVQIPPLTWHGYICHQSGTLALEVKEGAYIPTAEPDFAPWAPAENSDGSRDYLTYLRNS